MYFHKNIDVLLEYLRMFESRDFTSSMLIHIILKSYRRHEPQICITF